MSQLEWSAKATRNSGNGVGPSGVRARQKNEIVPRWAYTLPGADHARRWNSWQRRAGPEAPSGTVDTSSTKVGSAEPGVATSAVVPWSAERWKSSLGSGWAEASADAARNAAQSGKRTGWREADMGNRGERWGGRASCAAACCGPERDRNTPSEIRAQVCSEWVSVLARALPRSEVRRVQARWPTGPEMISDVVSKIRGTAWRAGRSGAVRPMDRAA